MPDDRFGRNIHYLRISLTDHCNLRCLYCMPEDQTFLPNAELMQDDEIIQLLQLFTSLGFDKIRLTGGEPTVRAHIVDLVREMAATPGVKSLSMTTNGVLLGKLAAPLKEAGLQRVNISLDTLDPGRFKSLTRWGKFEDVWQGIQAAEAVGLTPLKLNMVVVRGHNLDDVVSMANLTYAHNWQIRFIEMMPFAGQTDFQTNLVVSDKEILEKISNGLDKPDLLNHGILDGEARQLGVVSEIELFEQTESVGVRGLDADVVGLGDLGVSLPVRLAAHGQIHPHLRAFAGEVKPEAFQNPRIAILRHTNHMLIGPGQLSCHLLLEF